MAKKQTPSRANLYKYLLESFQGADSEKIDSMFLPIISEMNEEECASMLEYLQGKKNGLINRIQQIFQEQKGKDLQESAYLALYFTFLVHESTQRYWSNHEEDKKRLIESYTMYFAGIEATDALDPFVKIAQTPATNALSQIARYGIQYMLDSPDAVATVGKGKKEVKFKFGNAQENGLIKTQDLMLLDALLIVFQQTKQQLITLSIEDYALMRGRTATTENKREIRKEVIDSLERLRNIGASYNEKVRGKYVARGGMRLNGGTALVKNGIIYWNWNTDCMSSLQIMAPMDYSKETLLADPRTNVYYFSRYIDQHYRMNEGNPNENVIGVSTLVNVAKNLPTIVDIKAKRGSPKQKIIQPFFRDLDSISRLIYKVIDKDGNEVEPENLTDYDTFIACKIVFDSEDAGYPVHPERIKARKKREKDAKKDG